jgi:hypothetical protein
MSQAPSTYERIDGDKYFTPHWVTEALLSVETFAGGIWDPAAGAGDILAALPPGMLCHGSDIAPDAPQITAIDFFDVKTGIWPNIVGNPPYGTGSRLAVKFIDHALKLTEPLGGKVAMLLKVGFDSAPGRRRLFADHPAFAAEYRITKRIHWANIEVKLDAKGRPVPPTEHHSWLIWDWRKRGGAAVKGYLPLHG